jgi:hypothetical protein
MNRHSLTCMYTERAEMKHPSTHRNPTINPTSQIPQTHTQAWSPSRTWSSPPSSSWPAIAPPPQPQPQPPPQKAWAARSPAPALTPSPRPPRQRRWRRWHPRRGTGKQRRRKSTWCGNSGDRAWRVAGPGSTTGRRRLRRRGQGPRTGRGGRVATARVTAGGGRRRGRGKTRCRPRGRWSGRTRQG